MDSLTLWTLIVFLRAGPAGGVVQIDMPAVQVCAAALEDMRKMDTFRDGICVPRFPRTSIDKGASNNG